MIRFWCALLFASAAIAVAQQTPVPPTPDQQLTLKLMDGDRKKVSGDIPGALKEYESCLARVKATPAIQRREEEVLQRLSTGYIAVKRYPEAVAISRRILALHHADCQPGAPFIERCGDAHYGLGLALMYTQDFAQADAELTHSVAEFRASTGRGDEIMRMNSMKNLGNAESMLGAAQFRAGDKPSAIATLRRAIADLKTVADNQKIDPATRGSAAQSLKDAETSLHLLESAAPAKP